MARFILRYRGAGPLPEEDLARIAALPGLEVVDRTPRMLLVDAPADPLAALVAGLPEWVVSPERPIPLPDPTRGSPREE